MPTWPSTSYLREHFRKHHRLLGVRTVAEYDASARETVEFGTYFEYRDLESNELRVGYYHPETRRFTGLSDDEAIITTHLRCPESYVRNNLRGSTYA